MRQWAINMAWCVPLCIWICDGRRPPLPVAAAAATEPSRPTTPSALAPSLAPSTLAIVAQPGPLPELMPKQVMGKLPEHFDPVGPHVGIITGKRCDIWNLEVGAYAGNIDAKLCTEWDKHWHPERSHDGKWVATVKRGTLNIQPAVDQVARDPAKVTLQDKTLRCNDAAEVHFSPDDSQVAVHCLGTLAFVVVDWKCQPARIAATLKPEKGSKNPPGTPSPDRLSDRFSITEWAWGPAGIVAAGIRGGNSILVRWWPAHDKPPSTSNVGDNFAGVDSGDEVRDTYLLDPGGRAVFLVRYRSRDGAWGEVFSLRTGALLDDIMGTIEHSDYWDNKTVSLADGHWLPGPHPVWETLEKTTVDEPAVLSTWKAHRIYTGPGARGLRTQELPRQPPLHRVVQADGKTIVRAKGKPPESPLPAACQKQNCDPSGRFIGVDLNTVRRIADGAKLSFTDDGCAQTGQGVFDCWLHRPLDSIRERVERTKQGCVSTPNGLLDCREGHARALAFRGGDDPLHSPLFRGDRIFQWLHHPGLVDDFFDGKSVALPVGLAGFVPPSSGAGP